MSDENKNNWVWFIDPMNQSIVTEDDGNQNSKLIVSGLKYQSDEIICEKGREIELPSTWTYVDETGEQKTVGVEYSVREADKEKASIKDAIDLGLELMFNYNLYPAIITACKNLDELDIYLAYLETGEIDKFKIFNIIYQLSPTLSK